MTSTDPETAEWLAWASSYAEMIDPLVTGVAPPDITVPASLVAVDVPTDVRQVVGVPGVGTAINPENRLDHELD